MHHLIVGTELTCVLFESQHKGKADFKIKLSSIDRHISNVHSCKQICHSSVIHNLYCLRKVFPITKQSAVNYYWMISFCTTRGQHRLQVIHLPHRMCSLVELLLSTISLVIHVFYQFLLLNNKVNPYKSHHESRQPNTSYTC